jgi:nucleotide-binding universal stress UspA family protein
LRIGKWLGFDIVSVRGILRKNAMKILIAYDGSEYADAAIKDLRKAGLPDEAETTVLCIAEEWLPPPPPSSYEIVEAALSEGIAVRVERTKGESSRRSQQAKECASASAQVVRSYFPGWQVRAEALSGSPASEIIAQADEENADLIVVGSQGRGALSRALLGSVSQRIVTGAHCSVRVARAGSQQTDLPIRIIVGLDRSPDALSAIHAVAGRNWLAKTEVRLVTAVDFNDMSSMPPEEKPAAVSSAHHSAETILRAAGLQVSSLIEEKPPKYLLVDEAERWKADCIFVGARGLTRLGRILLGSVSTAVVSRAHCSVEVVRPSRAK